MKEKPRLGSLPIWLESDVNHLKSIYESAEVNRKQAVEHQVRVYLDKSPEAQAAAGEMAIQHMLSFHRPFFVSINERFDRLRDFCKLHDLDAAEYLRAAGVPDRFAEDLARAQADLARGLS